MKRTIVEERIDLLALQEPYSRDEVVPNWGRGRMVYARTGLECDVYRKG